MKKKIITIAAIGSFVLLTAVYSIFSTEKNQVNSLMLENIEALAFGEEGELNTPCYNTTNYDSTKPLAMACWGCHLQHINIDGVNTDYCR